MKEKVALISILANIVLALGKITVGILSNSIAVLAEGAHSFIDIISSAIGYIGIKISQKPEDQKHPYGYHKFEVAGGLLITLILLGTGLGIIYEAYQGIIKPEEIKIGYLAFSVMVFSAVINEIMARLKIHVGKIENSISLLSDGFHSRIDVFSSLAILGGLILTKYWVYADSLSALLIGLYIIKESLSLGKEAAGSLLDVSAGKETEEKIRAIAKGQNIEISSLKTQKKGGVITVDLAIILSSSLNVKEAEVISSGLREKLMKEIGNLSYVVIQIESHKISTGFYKPSFGKGFGWLKRGKFIDEIREAKGMGVGGNCVCPKCGYKTSHQRGAPCSSLTCPTCGLDLERK